MKIERRHKKSLFIVLQLFVVAWILSIILVFVIREFVGLEVFSNFLLFPTDISIPYPFNLIGLLLIVLGFILIVWANYTLLFVGKIGLESRDPFHVPSTLVIQGPYQFSRNPIYLSVILILFGFAILGSSLTLFIIAITLFILFRTLLISWEEKKLEEAFGEDYLELKQRVRRWF